MLRNSNSILQRTIGLSLIKTNHNKEKGFTLIEAIVSLAIFAIAFSGLFLFFGMATLANNNTEKRMYLNLTANHIIESIAAESTRSNGDILNPFVTPTSYSGSLGTCADYLETDIRRTWCNSLNEKVGPEGSYPDEQRIIEIFRVDNDNNPIADGVSFDNGNLIVNVSLVVDGGSGANKLISSFFTRKIRR
jgi:prepilin-type N-terminal cleavage/methylation domain-containing protein